MRLKPPAVQGLFNHVPSLEQIHRSIEHFAPGTPEFDVNVVVFVAALFSADAEESAELAKLDRQFVEDVFLRFEQSGLDLKEESGDWKAKNSALAHGTIVLHVMIGAGETFRSWDEELEEYIYHHAKTVAALRRANAYEAVVEYSASCDECRTRATAE